VIGALVQARLALKPDGLFIGALLGGATLTELRQSLTAAELELTGGAGPRVSPFADSSDAAGLLQRAGFALPVADVDRVTVRYDHPLKLLADLRRMGETSVLAERHPRPLTRRVLARAFELYQQNFADPDGRLPATFEILTLTGWSPSETQQKPLRPGSAKMRLADALGGVDVCVAEEINDDFTQTYLTAGNHTLSGIAALQFLRTRHGVGDGSDLSRISNQQVFLSALVRKLKSEGTLTNPLTLYNLAKAAVSNLTLSESLNNVDTMVSIAMALRSIPLDRVVFVQYPGSTGGEGIYLGKVAPKQEAADELFAALIADLPIALGGDTGAGSIKSGQIATDPVPTAAPRPTGTSTAVPTAPPVEVLPEPVVLSGQLLGQNAGEVTCSKGNN
jgi:hypothetical protein